MALHLPTLDRPDRGNPSTQTTGMPLVGHLTELRNRLLISAAVVTVGAIVVFIVFNHVLGFLVSPYCHTVGTGHSCNLYVTGPLDGLSIRVKVAAYGGIVLASPVLLWQVWRFIAPGLHRGEKRYAYPFVAASLVLFLGGAAVAFAVFPHTLRFLETIGGPSLQQIYSPSSYIGLLLLMMAAFGITFELPVLLVFLQIAGVVTPQRLSSWRRWAIVAMVAFAGIITPSSDPFSMLALAVPLLVFYELSIVVGRLILRSRATAP
jgi:sec-independent protein translocase protein TatC